MQAKYIISKIYVYNLDKYYLNGVSVRVRKTLIPFIFKELIFLEKLFSKFLTNQT